MLTRIQVFPRERLRPSSAPMHSRAYSSTTGAYKHELSAGLIQVFFKFHIRIIVDVQTHIIVVIDERKRALISTMCTSGVIKRELTKKALQENEGEGSGKVSRMDSSDEFS